VKRVGKDMVKKLHDFQLSLEVSGGAKAILHSANKVLSQ